MIPDIFDNPAVLRMGWALLHFLWQGALIALVLKGTLLLIAHRFAMLRYTLALATLFLMALLPVFLLCKTQRPPDEISAAHGIIRADVSAADASAEAMVPGPHRAPLPSAYSRWFTPLAPWIALAWAAGAALLLLKTLGGVLQVRLLKHKAAIYGETKAASSFCYLAARVGIPGVPVLESDLVSGPTVAGWIKPIVLLPRDISRRIEPAMLDALTAHEFAHIRRNDGAMNLLQTILEDLFFFHPALWWVSSCIRAEREACCDDDAAAICGDTLLYARALSQAEQFRSSMPVMAFNRSSLLQRVRRLTDMKKEKPSSTCAFYVALMAAAFAILATAGSVSLAVMPPQDSQNASGPQSGEKKLSPNKPAPKKAVSQKPIQGSIVGGIPAGAYDASRPVPPPPPPQNNSGSAEPGAASGFIIAGSAPASSPGVVVPGKIAVSKRIYKVAPVYPEQAIRARASAKVILRIRVDAAGQVAEAKVLQGHPLFNNAAVSAVMQWKYSQTFLNGKPVPIIATVSIVFAFGKDGTTKVID